MEKPWHFFSDLGIRETDNQEIRVWKSMQNQLVLVFFAFLLLANTFAIFISPSDQLIRVAGYTFLLSVVLFLHAENRFRLARFLLMTLFIPICFLPNWILGVPVKLPYLSVNALIVYIVEYLILSFVLPGPGHSFRFYYIGFLMLAFVCDIFYVPAILGHSTSEVLEIVFALDFMIFKTIFAIVIMMQLFTMNFINRFVRGLMERNRKLEASIEEKLMELKNKMNP